MASIRQAQIPTVIRSHQKDEYYISIFRSKLSAVGKIFQGVTSSRLKELVTMFAESVYFFLTTISGLQTLGEEYVNNFLIDSMQKSVPSVSKRVAMVFLKVFGHVGLLYVLQLTSAKISSLEMMPGKNKSLSIDILRRAVSAIGLLLNLHKAVFFLEGVYYHLSKRLLGVSNVSLRGKSLVGLQKNSYLYRIIGYVGLFQLSFQMFNLLHQRQVPSTISVQSVEEDTASCYEEREDRQFKCSLCLCPRKVSTATPCGHIFCWVCILEWSQTKQVCPICRSDYTASSLIVLREYDLYD